MPSVDPAQRRRLVAVLELLAFAALVMTHWSFYSEHRLFDQLLNFGENYAYVLNAGEGRFFLATALLTFPAAALLVDASMRLFAPPKEPTATPIRPEAVLVLAVGAALACEACALILGYAQFTDDERMYLFQARALLEGGFTAERPKPIEFFHPHYAYMLPLPGGRWASTYPPGQPALIALGLLLHTPHLSQSIAVGLIVWVSGRMAEDAWGRSAGVLTAALVAVSPLVLLVGATLHNDVPTTLFGLLALWAALRCHRSGSIRYAALAGAAVGATILCRPFDGFLAAAPVGGLLLHGLLRPTEGSPGRRARGFGIGAAALAGLPFLVVFFLWQRAVTGSAFVAPYALFVAQWPGAHTFGFGLTAWGVENTPRLAFSKGLVEFARFDGWLLGWPLASAASLLVLLGVGRDRTASWLLSAIALNAVGYWFYASVSVHTFGSYYQLPIAPLMAALLARLTLTLGDFLRVHGPGAAAVPLRALGGLTVASLFFFWAPQLDYLGRVARRINAPLVAAQAAAKDGPIVVFLWHMQVQPKNRLRHTAWTFLPPYTDARFSDRVVWAMDYGLHNLALLRALPDRRAFYFVWDEEDAEPVLVPWTPELGRKTAGFPENPDIDFGAMEKSLPFDIFPQPQALLLPEGIGAQLLHDLAEREAADVAARPAASNSAPPPGPP